MKQNQLSTHPDISEEDLEWVFSVLLSGALIAPTPFSEMEELIPVVWAKALEVFGGDRSIARAWLETRSTAFDNRRPLSVAMQETGERRVLKELLRMQTLRVRPTKNGSSGNP